ncbi:MAG: hypothetical protein V9G25_06475 [Acidimicrobiia bacterium]
MANKAIFNIVFLSEITEFFYNSLMEILPPDLQENLKSYSQVVIELSPENDGERAWLCAKWGVELAGDEDGNIFAEIGDEIRTSYDVLKAVTFGFKFWLSSSEGITPEFAVQISWVQDSIAIAKQVGEKRGWEAVNWKEHLEEMCSK